MIEIRTIDEKHKQDINIPNEPFPLYGRMIPSYINEQWQYEIVHFGKGDIDKMCFPDENYDYDAMRNNHVFIGAYDGEKCIGLAILRDEWMKYMYLYDLKQQKTTAIRASRMHLLKSQKRLAKKKVIADCIPKDRTIIFPPVSST